MDNNIGYFMYGAKIICGVFTLTAYLHSLRHKEEDTTAILLSYIVFTMVHDTWLLCKQAFCDDIHDTTYKKSDTSNQSRDNDTEPDQPNQKDGAEQNEEADEQEQKVEITDAEDEKEKDKDV